MAVNSVDNFRMKNLLVKSISENIRVFLQGRTMQQKNSTGLFALISDFRRGKRDVGQERPHRRQLQNATRTSPKVFHQNS